MAEISAARLLETPPASPSAPGLLSSELEVAAARNELEAVPWTRLDPVPDYFLAVVGTRPEVIRPHVARLPGDIVFAGRLEKIPLSVSVGYRTVYSPKVPRDHAGARRRVRRRIGRPGRRAARRPCGTSLPDGDADVLSLPALRVGSPLHTAAIAVPSALRGRFRHRSTHWSLQLPDSYDEFIKSRSKKTRENVRVYGNRLQRDHGDGLSLRVFRDPAEMDELLAEIETVAALTYQRGLGVAAADTDEDRMLTELA